MTADVVRYTVDELARKVGMSPRNIRAHQTRGLLGPPTRRGRTAYYDDSHVQRLEAIKALQRQGYNLVAIEAILGVRSPEPSSESLYLMLQRLGTEFPALVQALGRHGVLIRGEDGTVRMVRPRLLRSALELKRTGMSTVASLQILTEVLESLRLVSEDLVRITCKRILALGQEVPRSRAASWEELDREAEMLANNMIGLLTEAFRLTLENSGQSAVTDLISLRHDAQLEMTSSAVIDAG